MDPSTIIADLIATGAGLFTPPSTNIEVLSGPPLARDGGAMMRVEFKGCGGGIAKSIEVLADSGCGCTMSDGVEELREGVDIERPYIAPGACCKAAALEGCARNGPSSELPGMAGLPGTGARPLPASILRAESVYEPRCEEAGKNGSSNNSPLCDFRCTRP